MVVSVVFAAIGPLLAIIALILGAPLGVSLIERMGTENPLVMFIGLLAGSIGIVTLLGFIVCWLALWITRKVESIRAKSK